jgi:hypothetical protein
MGTDPEHFHLIAPYENKPKRWSKLKWIDQYSGNRYQITTKEHFGTRQSARIKTYGEIILEYEFHPEPKCADANGNICRKQTIGLLQRRNIKIDSIKCIGKESNLFEDVESETIHSMQDVYTEYPDPRRDEWEMKIRPALKKISLSLLEKESGLSRRMLIKARNGRTRPHRNNRKMLAEIVRKLGIN